MNGYGYMPTMGGFNGRGPWWSQQGGPTVGGRMRLPVDLPDPETDLEEQWKKRTLIPRLGTAGGSKRVMPMMYPIAAEMGRRF